jgi:hypothetical protein
MSLDLVDGFPENISGAIYASILCVVLTDIFRFRPKSAILTIRRLFFSKMLKTLLFYALVVTGHILQFGKNF